MNDVKDEKFDDENRHVSVSSVLLLVGVSSSGYYSWLNREPSQQSLHKEVMKEKITEVYNESKQIYGAPKITRILHARGYGISERTVSTYMNELEIKAIWVSPYKRTTIDPDFDNHLKNILKRDFNPKAPNTVWVTDITYIYTLSGFVYLTSVMDLFSRKIVGWHLSNSLSTEHVIMAIKKAKRNRKTRHPIIIHSDRGCQYVSDSYIKETSASNLIRSYSRTGNPWDNACIESFHSLIKREWLNRYAIKNLKHARKLIFEYIDAFYNTVRIHSYCDMKSPVNYEKQYIS